MNNFTWKIKKCKLLYYDGFREIGKLLLISFWELGNLAFMRSLYFIVFWEVRISSPRSTRFHYRLTIPHRSKLTWRRNGWGPISLPKIDLTWLGSTNELLRHKQNILTKHTIKNALYQDHKNYLQKGLSAWFTKFRNVQHDFQYRHFNSYQSPFCKNNLRNLYQRSKYKHASVINNSNKTRRINK